MTLNDACTQPHDQNDRFVPLVVLVENDSGPRDHHRLTGPAKIRVRRRGDLLHPRVDADILQSAIVGLPAGL